MAWNLVAEMSAATVLQVGNVLTMSFVPELRIILYHLHSQAVYPKRSHFSITISQHLNPFFMP
jgi:hypothetical protein